MNASVQMLPLNPQEIKQVNDLFYRGFYSMAFQPIYNLNTKELVGFEALLRGPQGTPLNSPGRIFNQQNSFTDLFLHQLDLSCLGSAIRTGRLFPDRYLLFVNIHGVTIKVLLEKIKYLRLLLKEMQISPRRVVLEVSETTPQELIIEALENIQSIKEEGLSIAIDDISQDHPWFAMSQTLRPTFLKVDRAIIHGLQESARNQKILSDLIIFAEQVSAQIIAEGIETVEEMTALQNMAIPFGQGFLLGHPKSAEVWLTELNHDMTAIKAIPGVSGWDDVHQSLSEQNRRSPTF